MPKVIKSDVREIVLKIKEYFLQEKEYSAPIIPFERVNERVAAATGISLRTVVRISNEGKLAEATCSKIVAPGKHRKIRKDKILLDNLDIGVLRRKIHEFYGIRKEIPTVQKLYHILKEETGFVGSREILRQHIKKIGFRFRKTKSNRKILVEKNSITAWRAHYLQSIKHNEETEKLPVVYLDESYIHSGLTAGLNLKRWVSEKLEPILKRRTLIIMDNSPQENTSINRTPSINSTKNEVIEWLLSHSIEFSHEYSKPQLLEIVKRHKPEPVYAIDAILNGLGHKVLRLPPYHCDLNPIDMVYASTKRKVAEVNFGNLSREMPELVDNAFKEITTEEWSVYCGHLKNLEEEYRLLDIYLDKPFIIQVCSDEESSDSEDYYDDGSC